MYSDLEKGSFLDIPIKLKDSSVTTAKLADSAVTEPKIANLNVTTGKLDNLGVTTGKLANSSVTHRKLSLPTIKTAYSHVGSIGAGSSSIFTSVSGSGILLGFTIQGFQGSTYSNLHLLGLRIIIDGAVFVETTKLFKGYDSPACDNYYQEATALVFAPFTSKFRIDYRNYDTDHPQDAQHLRTWYYLD